METPFRAGAGRVLDLEGQVPLGVVVWLEQHPTAALAAALSAASSGLRLHFRVASDTEVVLRGARVEVLDARAGARIGSARLQGVRSAMDFDRLPRAMEPPPFAPPEPPFPASFGYACDRDGRVGRFLLTNNTGPTVGLAPRATQYEPSPASLDDLVRALSCAHQRPAHPIRAFSARVKELVSALAQSTVVGQARAYAWFEDDRAVLWPTQPGELVPLLVSSLHARKACLGCSSHDPRDPLSRGTWLYAKSTRGGEQFVREDPPVDPLDVPTAAQLLGRSGAELAATQLPLRFEDSPRIDPSRFRWAS